ncbi:methyltransferase family protein [Kribbella pratensis]|uniref:Methyltransferase family protein n=2 Tax=Kribbella pratensis TaxID=2512112 RepID=A0A4R8CLJ3_9ACTN|nr:methyltransferase family protein [Kribbella pratensis]
MAESFGADPGLYDRARPRYPDALIEAVVASSAGPSLLDVGCGTGIAARQFQAAGCQVLGVEVDERMAAFARRTGVEVEVSSFESWDPAGRTFDALVAGMTWHWIDPSAGAAKAAEVLKPGGRFAVFWSVLQPPPELGAAFAAVHRDVLPDSPVNSRVAASPLGAYEHFLDRAADSLTAIGAFRDLERPTYPWSRVYTRDEWLDQLRTSGIAKPLADAGKLDEMLVRTGAAIDAAGGSFTLDSTAVALTATRN